MSLALPGAPLAKLFLLREGNFWIERTKHDADSSYPAHHRRLLQPCRGRVNHHNMDKRFDIVQSFNRHLRQKSRLQAADGYGNNKAPSADQRPDGAETRLSNAELRPPVGRQHSDGGGSVGASKLDSLSINPNKRAAAESVNDPYPGDGARRIKQRSGLAADSDVTFIHRAPQAPQASLPRLTNQAAVTSNFNATSHQSTNLPATTVSASPPRHHAGVIPRHKIKGSLGSTGAHGYTSNRNSYAGSVPLSPVSSPVVDSFGPTEFRMLLQPETRPITQDQLVNEVRGIYAGLVMVEKKCVEIDQQQSQTTNKLSNEQWQALIALHRTLLHEHHDFFLASQHPSSSPALRRLATKYAMPARMWRHGIHSFLELLRHRLPDSLDHMLAFVYLAYSMMALLMESVPSFEETWIECLGDLARYRMAIEEADLRDREIWSGVARMWYDKAADKSPNVGRIQHHLAVLARPNVSQQLFYYTKALVSVVPFPNARESIMLLYNPFLEESETASSRYALVESALVKGCGILFIRGNILDLLQLMDDLSTNLDKAIGRTKEKFRVQGPEFACSLCAATLDFGNSDAFLTSAFRALEDQRKAQAANDSGATPSEPGQSEVRLHEDHTQRYSDVNVAMQANWAAIDPNTDPIRAARCSDKDSISTDAVFTGSDQVTAHACRALRQTTVVVAERVGDKDIVPYMHSTLVYIYGLAFVPSALQYVEAYIPWDQIAIFLNTLGRSGTDPKHFEGADFPEHRSGTGRQLPEDFLLRGLVWAQYYFPPGFFEGQVVDEEERTLELPSHAAPRVERCLWLGIRLACVSPLPQSDQAAPNLPQLGRWLNYSTQTKQFSVTDFARSLESTYTFDCRSQTMSVERDLDTDMFEDEH